MIVCRARDLGQAGVAAPRRHAAGSSGGRDPRSRPAGTSATRGPRDAAPFPADHARASDVVAEVAAITAAWAIWASVLPELISIAGLSA